jgi:hypothetical protein
MLLPFTYSCPVCGQRSDSAADPSQGQLQRYVEDCQVCCRPLVLELRIEDDAVLAHAEAESE